MDTLIIACKALTDELNLVMADTGCNYPILWIEPTLHEHPELLRKRLQEELDQVSVDIERVFLTFGFCGNAVLGIRAHDFLMILPRVEDCITLLLGSAEKRKEITAEMETYFLTKGWLVYEANIWSEYQKSIERMGEAKAKRVFKMLLGRYKRLGIIETGAFALEEFQESTKNIALEFNLNHQVISGTTQYLKKLLTGPWDDEFIIVNPGEEITLRHIYNLDG